MVDVHTPKQRSFNMSRIKGKDTRPELLIRKRLHSQGFRYRLHVKGLPGKPDIVFPKYKAVVFINGCFWHHHDCDLFKMPATRQKWWQNKLEKTREKDRENIQNLLAAGWRVLLVWECSFRKTKKVDSQKIDKVISNIQQWLISNEIYKEIVELK